MTDLTKLDVDSLLYEYENRAEVVPLEVAEEIARRLREQEQLYAVSYEHRVELSEKLKIAESALLACKVECTAMAKNDYVFRYIVANFYSCSRSWEAPDRKYWNLQPLPPTEGKNMLDALYNMVDNLKATGLDGYITDNSCALTGSKIMAVVEAAKKVPLGDEYGYLQPWEHDLFSALQELEAKHDVDIPK